MKTCDYFNVLLISVVMLVSSALYFSGCSDQATGNTSIQKPDSIDYSKVPEGFPPIPFPKDNPYSAAKVELGRRLFYEKILSKDSTISCSHCMKQEKAFTSPLAVPRGYNNEPQTRNSWSVVNSAYQKEIFWDGRSTKIESPAYRSIFLPNVFAADTNVINSRLQNNYLYLMLFEKAFGNGTKPNCYLASQAIATFIRTMVSGNSRYDQYNRGNKQAMNEQEIRGMNLFFSSRVHCTKCHSGFLFTDFKYRNTGTTTHYFDRGRYYATGNLEDRNKFQTPSLRNVEVTGPYMHEGNFESLERVMNHYNAGGMANNLKDPIMVPLNLTEQEKADLIAFLKTLTDWEFLKNPRFSEPK